MSNYLKKSSLILGFLSLTVVFVFSGLASAAGKGKGMMLRDGSCTGSKAQYQSAGTRNDANGFRNPDGTGRYGDGTRPRPQDGTGFGARR